MGFRNLKKVRGCESSVVIYHVFDYYYNDLEIITRARNKLVFIIDQTDQVIQGYQRRGFKQLLKDAETQHFVELIKCSNS